MRGMQPEPVVAPAFTADEYAERLRRTRERMAAGGHDLLIVADPANINYLTGYDAWTFSTPQTLAVPADGDLLLSRCFFVVFGH